MNRNIVNSRLTMLTNFQQILVRALLGCCSALLVCCTGVSTDARRVQSIDGVRGSGNLATTAFRATVVSAIRQPVTTVKLGLAILWLRPREIITGNSPANQAPQPPLREIPGTDAFEKLLDRKHFPAAESGTIRLFVDGSRFFPELDRSIAAARHSIDCQIFIFDNDDIGVKYADLLKHRSAEVKVHVLFDDFGSYGSYSAAPKTLGPHGFVPPSDMHVYLRDHSHVRARRTLNPWLVADHTKLLVFDQSTAFIGGMNIGREYYSEWHDMMIRVDGPVVRTLSREFSRAWRKAGPMGDLALLRKPEILRHPHSVTDGIALRVLRTDPAEGRQEILDAMLLAIRGARKRVWIENPYFANDDITKAVEAAARRGVDVRVIIPTAGYSPIMDASNLATAHGIILAGGKIFRYQKMTHLKAMICDDWAIVGSANLDTLSMRINRELNLAFSHRPSVMELEKAVFQSDFRRSRRIRLAETTGLVNGIAEIIADQL
jgi:cardiolipin synthase A/B